MATVAFGNGRRPSSLREVITKVRQSPDLNEGMRVLKERANEFSDPMALALAGIALHPPAREYLDDQLDRIWRQATLPASASEVIIGAGFHAAVYASGRVAAGYPKPLVLEASDRVGGAFAVSQKPSFFLNSRNRSGPLGIPGRGEALNVLPCGPIQPSALSGAEYQLNSDLAFAIRVALALNAKVVTGFEAAPRSFNGSKVFAGKLDTFIKTKRVIVATGIKERRPPIEHQRMLTFSQFMRRMDDTFPLRGMGRVAVIGAGDSGKTVIEALIGQGPSSGMSVAFLDSPERIDWYGVNENATNKGGWENCNRSRYKGISRALPRNTGREARVRPQAFRASEVYGDYDRVSINGMTYDYAIWCAGYDARAGGDGEEEIGFEVVDARNVARKLVRNLYEVGPAADIPMTTYEREALPADIPENSIALFRTAGRTATLANVLGAT